MEWYAIRMECWKRKEFCFTHNVAEIASCSLPPMFFSSTWEHSYTPFLSLPYKQWDHACVWVLAVRDRPLFQIRPINHTHSFVSISPFQLWNGDGCLRWPRTPHKEEGRAPAAWTTAQRRATSPTSSPAHTGIWPTNRLLFVWEPIYIHLHLFTIAGGLA